MDEGLKKVLMAIGAFVVILIVLSFVLTVVMTILKIVVPLAIIGIIGYFVYTKFIKKHK